MAAMREEGTALGAARARFLEGLARKATELRDMAQELQRSPADERGREELRRRLHALYASAQVFREDALAAEVQTALRQVDAARERGSFQDVDFEALETLVERLPDFVPSAGAAPGRGVPSTAPGPSMRPASGAPSRSDALPAPPKAPPVHGESASPHQPPQEAPLQSSAPTREPDAAAGGSILSVLILADAQVRGEVDMLLPVDRFERLFAADRAEALRAVRATAPDLVLVQTSWLEGDADWLGELQDDPAVGFIPLVLLDEGEGERGEDIDAQARLMRPWKRDSVQRALTSVAQAWTGHVRRTRPLRLDVAEIAEHVAEEIHRGLVDSIIEGQDLTVPLQDATELRAAAWATVGRLRNLMSRRTDGRVRFRDRVDVGGPRMLALAENAPPPTLPDEPVLERHRILVVDDDPVVVWFFGQALQEAGATVVEASDGETALELARRQRPDVVISDIFMPGIDGFALCRELKRDVTLADVPVILLSWKEDLLQRMQDLRAGASGYLRKEVERAQIVEEVLQVLQPRRRLAEALQRSEDVRGRLETLGLWTLLQTVADERPDARLALRDAWSELELELRDGEPVDIIRTGSDGSFARGRAALPLLVGVTAARFTVQTSRAPVRTAPGKPLGALLREAALELGALLDALAGTRLLQAVRVDFEPERLEAVLHAAPESLRTLVERLREGDGPRAMIQQARVDPEMLQAELQDLARQGAIRAVEGTEGRDLVAEARRMRQEQPGRLLRSSEPPAHELPAPQAQHMAAAEEPPSHAGFEDELDAAIQRGSQVEVEPPVVPPEEEPPQEAAGERQASSTGGKELRFFLLLLLCVGAGFGGYRLFQEWKAEQAAAAREAAVSQSRQAATQRPARRVSDRAGSEVAARAPDSRLDDRQGLLLVDGEAASGLRVRIGERNLGSPPIETALRAGRHELRFERGDRVSFRAVTLEAGKKQRVRVPELLAASD